jgi:PPOX class probable F420-dependent enzyme
MAAPISPGLQKLLREPAYCEIATLMPDGSPHIAQVWVDTDGDHILINTPEGTQKLRNIRRDPRVAVNVVDPKNSYRVAAVRGKVSEVTTEGADDQIDRLAYKYLGQEKYMFRQPGQIRVMVKVTPEKINEIGTNGSA